MSDDKWSVHRVTWGQRLSSTVLWQDGWLVHLLGSLSWLWLKLDAKWWGVRIACTVHVFIPYHSWQISLGGWRPVHNFRRESYKHIWPERARSTSGSSAVPRLLDEVHCWRCNPYGRCHRWIYCGCGRVWPLHYQGAPTRRLWSIWIFWSKTQSGHSRFVWYANLHGDGNVGSHLKLYPPTHWGGDKMDAISQTTSSSAFSRMKMFEFRLRLHWSLFLSVQFTISQHCFR